MSQAYSTYAVIKPAEQPAPGTAQEWLSCEVCSLTFKNQQHYAIHCGGTFHANRVAASQRMQQTSAAGSVEDPQGFGSSNNPSYWTGMQHAFSYDSQKSANRSQSGQGPSNAIAADAYQSQPQYVSYPVGKQAKQTPDGKAVGGYEAMYGMPGFGWSDMQQDSSKSDYQSQQYPAATQQTKGSPAAKSAAHDAWRNNYQPRSETSGVQTQKDFGAKKSTDYGYSTQDIPVESYSSQKSDAPSWSKIIEPAVQKTESYKTSSKAALYGSHDPFSSNTSTRVTEPWKSAPTSYEVDVLGVQARRAKEGSYGKAAQPARSKTRWDTGDDSSSREVKQQSGNDFDRPSTDSRRKEERDSYGRAGYQKSRESSNSRSNEDLYRRRDSSQWEDSRDRDSHRKQESNARNDSKRIDDPSRRDDLWSRETSYDTKRTTNKREIADVGKGREDSSGWDRSYAGDASSARYSSSRDVSLAGKAGRNENVQHSDQGFVNEAAGKQVIQPLVETEWRSDTWDAYGNEWQAKAPEVSRKPLQGQKTGYEQQQKTDWGVETVQSKTDASRMQAENVWNAEYLFPAASGVVSWSGEPGYTTAGFSSKDGRTEKTLAQGRTDKGSWGQKEFDKNSSGQLQAGNTWPTANSGRGAGTGMQRHSRPLVDQEWHSVSDVPSTFKQASKEPGQKPGANVGSYGDLNQGLSSYSTHLAPTLKSGQRPADPKAGYDWNWTSGAEEEEQFGASYDMQEFSTSTDYQVDPDWGGNYSDGRSGFPQPGLSDASNKGQKVPQAGQWTAWPNVEQRADVRGSGTFAKDQQTSQTGGLGRGQTGGLGRGQTAGLGRGQTAGLGRGQTGSLGRGQASSLGRGQTGFLEIESLVRGLGFGRGEVKGIEKPVGLGKSVQKGRGAERQDWEQSFNRGGQSLLGQVPGASSSSENSGWFRGQEMSGPTGVGRGGGRGQEMSGPTGVGRGGGRGQEMSGATSAGRGGGRGQEVFGATSAGRGGGRGVPGNRPAPQPGDVGGWHQGSQEQGKLPAGGGRGGSESSLGQRNSWGGAGVKPTASPTRGFEKVQDSKTPISLQEKMRQLSEQAFTKDWNEKNRGLQESRNPVRTSVAPSGGQTNSSVATAGQRPNQSRSSVPSLLDLNVVAPTGKSQKFDGPDDKYSRDAANSRQMNSGVIQQPSSAFSGKKPEQSPGSAFGGKKSEQSPGSAFGGKKPEQSPGSAFGGKKPEQSPGSAFGGKKPEQSPGSNRMSGSAMMPPVTTTSRLSFVAPSAGKNVSSNFNKQPSQSAVQPTAASVAAQKASAPKQCLLPTPSPSAQIQKKQTAPVPTPSTLAQSQNKQNVLGPTPSTLVQSQNKQNVPGPTPSTLVQSQNKQNVPGPTPSTLVQSQNKQNVPGPIPSTLVQSQNKQNVPGPTPSTLVQSQNKQNVPVTNPSMLVQGQNKQSAPVNVALKKPSNPLDPASARKIGVTTLVSSSVVSSQVSVATAQTGISSTTASKEQAVTNITRSASKLDSKAVTPAATAAEAKIGLKSSDAQLHGSCTSVTRSSSTTAAQPVIAAKPAPLTSSTGNTPTLDPSKKPVVQKTIPVAPRGTKKEDKDNEDECDRALSEALGQFFSEGKDGPAETVKSAVPAKRTASSAKFVPTIRTFAVKSMSGLSKDKDQSSGDNTKKPDGDTTTFDPTTITIKVEKEDFYPSEIQEGKAGGDPIAELSKLLPPNMMKEITSGHPSKELLVKVADLLPANVLKQAVDYLQSSGATQADPKESQSGVQLPGASVDVTSMVKANDEKSKAKSNEAPSKVQTVQSRKGLPNPVALGSTNAKVPVTGSSVGINKQPGTVASVVKPPIQASVVSSKRKYKDIDPTKLKNLTFDEMLQLFQELLQDVLGGLFEDDKKSSDISERKILDGLSVDDREMALKVRQMTGITDLSRITHTMNVLNSLNAETIQALGKLDKSIIASSLTGNEKAQKMGVTVLQQLTELMGKGSSSDAKQQKTGPPIPVGRGRGGSVRPPQPGLSAGRGVQSLLNLNFAGTPRLGPGSTGLASAARSLLPTPRLPQQPRFSVDSMMAARGMGLLPTPLQQAQMQNFQRPLLRKRAPIQSEDFYSFAPPMKRWR